MFGDGVDVDVKFQEFWQECFQFWLEGLEKECKQVIGFFWIWLFVVIVIVVVGLVVVGFMNDDNFGFFFVFLVFVFFVIMVGNSKISKLCKWVKEEFNIVIVEVCGMVYLVWLYLLVWFFIFCQYDLLLVFNCKYFEDYFFGEIDGCDFEFYEVYFEQCCCLKNCIYYVMVFCGVLMCIIFLCKVEGVIVIMCDQGWLNFL